MQANNSIWDHLVDAAVDNGDEPAVKGVYGATKGKKSLINYDTAKAAKLFSMEYKSLQETTKDAMAYFRHFSA